MAKKKLNHQPQDQQQQEDTTHTHTHTHQEKPAAMVESSEKLETLKSLNSLLLKETFERRQQVESLEQAKVALEAEVTRSVMERKALEVELTRASQETAVLEMEKDVFAVSMETQLGEMKGEMEKVKRESGFEIGVLEKRVSELMVDLEKARDVLSHVSRERDAVIGDLDVWIEEANGLKGKVVDMEKQVRKSGVEVGDLRMEYESLVAEKEKKERAIENALREKSLIQRDLEKALSVSEVLRREIEGHVTEKEEIEVEKNGKEVKIVELEKEVKHLNGIVSNLRNEEQGLRGKVLELEKSCGEVMEKEKEMLMEINAFLEEKREKEKHIEILMEEKSSVQTLLETAAKESEDMRKQIEDIIRERTAIEELKVSRESEIVELHTKVADLRADVVTLQESVREHEEKERQLSSEINHHKKAFDRVRLERDELQKLFDEEKTNGINLKLKVSEVEKMIEGTVEELGQTKTEYRTLLKEKEEMKNQIQLLVTEKDMVNKSLLDAQKDIDDLKAELASAGINSEQALSMLKSTVAHLSQSKYDRSGKQDVGITGQERGKQIQPYLAELERIKSAFNEKETSLEDLNRQLEVLQNSLADAHKKKSFWTVLCSATTVFAAASVAYVARGH